MLRDNIQAYKRKVFLNHLVKGTLIGMGVLVSAFFVVNAVEYIGRLDSQFRAVLFYSFLFLGLAALGYWVIWPLYKWFTADRQLSDDQAALQIGQHFPDIQDKLLNTLQLRALAAQSELAQASLAQRERSFGHVAFEQAIDLRQNRRYARFLVIPLFFSLAVLMWIPQFFTATTPRILYYDQTFEDPAPFRFVIGSEKLQAFKNEDFDLQLMLEGSQIPAEVQLVTPDGRRIRLQRDERNARSFAHTFRKIQAGMSFHFEAAGFRSNSYQIQVIARPSLKSFAAFLEYPRYTAKRHERVDNTGNLIVPAGTKIRWEIRTQEAEQVFFRFEHPDTSLKAADKRSGDNFEHTRQALRSETYQVSLQNAFAQNKEAIEYHLSVIPDEYPVLNMQQYQDTVLFDYLLLGGNIGDDYGITALNLRYRVVPAQATPEAKDKLAFKQAALTFNPSLINQSFFHQMKVSDLSIQEGEKLEYFVEVWDNDAVNGRKVTKTALYEFAIPTRSEVIEELTQTRQQTENQIDNTLKQAQELQKELQNVEDRLKGKNKLDWQDKKAIEELIKKRKELEEEIRQMQQQNDLLNQKQDKFNKPNEELAKKAEQLQKLMDELLDEETKKLYEELNKLLEKNNMDNQIQDMLRKMDFKQENLTKELDRALELFKKLQFEAKTEQIAKDLEKMAEKQQELSDKTKEAKKDELPGLQQEQQQLNEQMKELEKSFEELEKLNEQTSDPKDLDQLGEDREQIKQEQEQGLRQMQQNQRKDAAKSQQNAAKKMQQTAKKMQEMNQSSEMEEMAENYDDLRKILENLITLSFDQERLMVEFRNIRRVDPKFVQLSQEQLKLKDDARIIEDSLNALAKRVFAIKSVVTREMGEMNYQMDEAIDAIKKRIPEIASGKQQLAMTSMNNLALLLNDALDNMQQQMSQNMSGKQNKQKKGKSNPNLSELQQQLSQQIQDIQKSGKSGKQLSEELAKLAAQQEMIRNALKQQGQRMKENGAKKDGKDGENGKEGGNGKLEKLMEENEEDLVNKRITEETIRRQKEIMTRLLESEKAMREREMDEKREAKTAEQKPAEVPAEFSDYLKKKEQQIELLKTIPPALNQYYKNQVNEYFKKMGDAR